MGTKLANLQVFHGTAGELRALLPEAVIGQWSEDFVSVFSSEFTPFAVEPVAKSLSKQVEQPVLSVSLFDGDELALSIYQGGRRTFLHRHGYDTPRRMGDLPLFCRILGLPETDAALLRTVWGKANAEDQLALTEKLLGAPLYSDDRWLPKETCVRDVAAVEQWIADRPKPPKVKNKTRAVALCELPDHMNSVITDRYIFHELGWMGGGAVEQWEPDGSVTRLWAWDRECVGYPAGDDRIIVVGVERDAEEQVLSGSCSVLFDTAGLLPAGYPWREWPYSPPEFLPDGGFVINESLRDAGQIIKSVHRRYGPSGALMWEREFDGGEQFLFVKETGEMEMVFPDGTLMLDSGTGETLGGKNKAAVSWDLPYDSQMPHIADGTDTWGEQRLYDEEHPRGRYYLTRFDAGLAPIASAELPTYLSGLSLSPDRKRVYAFFFDAPPMIFHAETMEPEHILPDSSGLMPLTFDGAGRFWLLRRNGTLEAWDAELTTPVSRHRLKGAVRTFRLTAGGELCVITECCGKTEDMLCVYRIEG